MEVFRTREELQNQGLGIRPFNDECFRRVEEGFDSIAKPIRGLGELEELIAKIGGIRHTDRVSIKNRSLLLFVSDNGIVEEGVSQCGAEVTHAVAEMIGNNKSLSKILADKTDTKLIPVDIGMKGEPVNGLIYRRIREGTRNFSKHKAMTETETLKAIETGFNEAGKIIDNGADILLLGEMGIGNTSSATALSCALLKADPKAMTGYGAGLSEEGKIRKSTVINDALNMHNIDPNDPFEALSAFGGYDIAGMVGAILKCAKSGIPVCLDGLVTLSALLTADKLFPGAVKTAIPSNEPKEPMGKAILRELKLSGVINASLSNGEGLGGLLLLPLLDSCLSVYYEGLRFKDVRIEPYERFKA